MFMQPFNPVYANDNTSLVPQIWAKFGLAVLESNMVASQLVHRDFSDELAAFGDTVNTRKPSTYKVYRKVDTDNVTVQDAVTTNISVKLDQRPHVSFLIRDGEETLSMQDLISLHLVPAMTAMAEHFDKVVLGQYARFIGTAGTAGTVGGLTNANYKDYCAELSQRLDDAKAPPSGRQLIIPSVIKTKILQNSNFTNADQRGDQGTALREASLGRIFGFDHYMCQNMSSVAGSDKTTGFVINNAAGYSAGDTVLTVGTGTGALATGQWVTIGGKVHQITAHTETLGNTTSITIAPALWATVANAAPVTAWGVGAIDLVAGYAAGYSKTLILEDFTIFPKIGQFISFKTETDPYTIIDADSTAKTVLLDRPLKNALADEDACFTGPPADYGFAFLRNAIMLVNRPLKLPRAGAGAIAGMATHNGLAMRCVITYDGDKQGHLVTLDCLLGVAVLEQHFGAVLLG